MGSLGVVDGASIGEGAHGPGASNLEVVGSVGVAGGARSPGAGRLEVVDSVGGGARGPGVGSFGTSIALASAGARAAWNQQA